MWAASPPRSAPPPPPLLSGAGTGTSIGSQQPGASSSSVAAAVEKAGGRQQQQQQKDVEMQQHEGEEEGEGEGEDVTLRPFPRTLDVESVPAELKKEGSDWFALFNPRQAVNAKREREKVLDVELVHTLTHERFVLILILLLNFRSAFEYHSIVPSFTPYSLNNVRSLHFSFVQCGMLRQVQRRWDVPGDRVQPQCADL